MIRDNHLVIFEEKLDLSQLTERERMAYEAGLKEGHSSLPPGGWVYLILSTLLLLLMGIMIGSGYPNLLK